RIMDNQYFGPAALDNGGRGHSGIHNVEQARLAPPLGQQNPLPGELPQLLLALCLLLLAAFHEDRVRWRSLPDAVARRAVNDAITVRASAVAIPATVTVAVWALIFLRIWLIAAKQELACRPACLCDPVFAPLLEWFDDHGSLTIRL